MSTSLLPSDDCISASDRALIVPNVLADSPQNPDRSYDRVLHDRSRRLVESLVQHIYTVLSKMMCPKQSKACDDLVDQPVT